jgi:hypothetical protein
MARRSDHNQAGIVAALRAVGASVQDLHELGKGCPDLLVGYRGVNYLLEVKGERGKLTPAESAWLASWAGQAVVVETIPQALAAICEVCANLPGGSRGS